MALGFAIKDFSHVSMYRHDCDGNKKCSEAKLISQNKI